MQGDSTAGIDRFALPIYISGMMGIRTCSLSKVQMQLGACFDQVPAECRNQVTTSPLGSPGDPEEVSSIQLAYHEIPAAELDRLLGYAGITSANGPIGLDADFLPRAIGSGVRTQFLLFPLAGLESHLTAEEPRIADALRTLGSMDTFIQQRGDAMTAVEYLAAGVLTCINSCRTMKQALVITW